jgi:hypothetical protein
MSRQLKKCWETGDHFELRVTFTVERARPAGNTLRSRRRNESEPRLIGIGGASPLLPIRHDSGLGARPPVAAPCRTQRTAA